MDIWQYYGPYETRYARVECSGNIDPHKNDSKIACETITILEELSLSEFIKLVIDKKIEETKKTQGELCSSGDSAKIGSSGYSAKIGSSGDSAKIGSSGQYAQIYSTGSEAVIASAGINAKAKGSVGAWISLAEFDDNNKCVGFATGCIGQDGLLPDVWYIASGGKLTKENQ
jgi:hypothetical protein